MPPIYLVGNKLNTNPRILYSTNVVGREIKVVGRATTISRVPGSRPYSSLPRGQALPLPTSSPRYRRIRTVTATTVHGRPVRRTRRVRRNFRPGFNRTVKYRTRGKQNKKNDAVYRGDGSAVVHGPNWFSSHVSTIRRPRLLTSGRAN